MGRKHAGGRCCAAPKAKPSHPDNPLLSAFYARRKLMADQATDKWHLSDAATLNRRLLVGSGNLAANVSSGLAPWEKSIGGKPRTKAQKRAARAARKERQV